MSQLPAPPFVAFDFNNRTCIVTKVAKGRVTYVDCVLTVSSLSEDAFASTYKPVSYSVSTAAKVYMHGVPFRPNASPVAIDMLQRLTMLDLDQGRFDVTTERAKPAYEKAVAEKPKSVTSIRKVDQKISASKKAAKLAQDLPKQAQLIVQLIAEAGGSLTRGELVARLENDQRLVSKQPAQRILSFYQPKLVELGAITLD